MLKAVLRTRRNIDISKYFKLTAFMKKKSVGYKAKKSRVLNREDIDKFLVEALDEHYLMTKVLLIMGYTGACRREEITNILIDDIEDKKTMLLIKIPNTKTNNPRSFIINGEKELNLYRKYIALRPTNVPHRRLFINYNKGKCNKQPVGIHTVGNAPSKIATFLRLPNPEEYTGHCFRRSSATLLANGGADIIHLKRHGGWSSSQVAEGYIEDSVQNKIDIANKIQKAGISNTEIVSETHYNVSSSKNLTSTNNFETPCLQISNTNNCTFNITIQK